MSAYTDMLKRKYKPTFDLVRELRLVEDPTDEQRATLAQGIAELDIFKTEHERALGVDQKAIEAEDWYTSLDDPTAAPRGRTDRPAPASEGRAEVKALSSYLVEAREFKAPRNDFYNVREPAPVAALFPYVERKAPFIPTNLNLSTGARIIEPFQYARFPLLDLLRTVPWNDLVVPYLPLVFTNNAAEVDIGAAKPESTNAGAFATIQMRTVAHWKEVPRQILRYIAGLRPIIDDELRLGVLTRMQNSVLNGTGVGTAMRGIIPQITQTAAGASLIPQIFDAIATIESNGGIVDAILMNPADYAALVLEEYTNNQYNPLLVGERVGSYRVVKMGQIATGTAVVGDFSSSTVLFVGENANVQATEALGFKNNIVTIRAEMDAVVLVERPWLLVKCAGPLVPTP